ncbi:PREDICTED: transmembrane 9 superfamily member 12-like [Ipomoea nil]|uniref:transmembrane 9 superfamily member 12-like n=1 Tax=Ipomoea nil TaxID=35883 RepID=UPI0009012080|nr:PREDICTED: transmembrane 9 superfamily member 12-like [Ipomoea nil]
MAGPLISGGRCFSAFILLLLLLLISQACDGFLLPRSYKHVFSKGEGVYVRVKSLTSIDTQLPFSYYRLPYCKPLMGITESTRNLGQILMGDHVLNSPYRLHMNVNESLHLCTTPPLSESDVKLLKQKTRDLYQVNMILDDLPLMRYERRGGFENRWVGFPVGYTAMETDDDYLINHLKFRVLIHELEEKDHGEAYEIVGVEVVPCSIKYDPGKMSKLQMYDPIPSQSCSLELDKSQVIREKERVSFSYEIEFVKSEVRWESRWDAYLATEDAQFHWSSIVNSLIVMFLFAGGVLKILKNSVGAYGARRNQEFNEQVHQAKEKLPGWRLVRGDVFREPGHSKLLCVMVGNGVQITGTAILTVVFAALGFMPPASQGMLPLGLIVFYLLLGVASGYAGVRLWITIKGSPEEWKSVSWSIACFFPGFVFVILALLDIIYRENHSTRASSIYARLQLYVLWFSISVPLNLSGGYLATRAERTPHPVNTNHVPREITAPRYRSWFLVLVCGSIAFSVLFLQLFFILSSIWLGHFYSAFGFLLIVLLLLVVVCAQVSVVLTHLRLRAEDWKWWWKAFFASGSVGFYVFSYCTNYLIHDLNGLSGSASATLYLGYSLIISIAVMLSTGSVGFLTSFYFVRYLYSSLDIEGDQKSEESVELIAE